MNKRATVPYFPTPDIKRRWVRLGQERRGAVLWRAKCEALNRASDLDIQPALYAVLEHHFREPARTR